MPEQSFDPEGMAMVDKDAVSSNPEKDPHDWVTGEERATGPQESYLSTLAQQAGEHVEPGELTKAEASMKIEELKEQTGR
jgi:hypothetical protein